MDKTTAAINMAGIINLPLTCGTLNFESGLLGERCRTRTPAQTITKAKRVPILVNANTVLKFRNKAGTATTNPVKMVANEGVLYLGCRRENILGNNPSRLMLIQILG